MRVGLRGNERRGVGDRENRPLILPSFWFKGSVILMKLRTPKRSWFGFYLWILAELTIKTEKRFKCSFQMNKNQLRFNVSIIVDEKYFQKKNLGEWPCFLSILASLFTICLNSQLGSPVCF